MPSPYPGMDPYLEEPGVWPDVHHDLISEIKAVLTGQLRPKYYARVEQRVYVSDQDEDEIYESFIEIIDREQRRVVTVIEVVSPTNKVRGARGRESYLQKRTEVLHSSSHWVEIDLLREGEPLVAREVLPQGDYFVHVSRVERRPSGVVWPVRLPQRLPTVSIPLLPEDPDAPLDLQAALNAVYDRSAYDLEIDYRRDPSPSLPPQYRDWADQLLREKGLRS